MASAPRVVGRYALFGQIAAGGMATVHLGQMTGPLGFSKVVAIKRLHDSLAKNPELVAMFLDEARIVARLQHPNIVSVLDIVAEDGELLLVMEYVTGVALSTLLEQAPCTPRVAVAITSDALAGLHHAHETKNSKGEPIDLVHRDVSPQNLLVGVDGVARVLDFGIAKATGRLHETRPNHLKGKVAYMAPEILEGQPIDRRADVYAAGVVLWEALTGQRLFDGPIDSSLFARIVSGRVPRVSELRPGLERYDDVVARALHRDPGERYATARDMQLALEQCGPAATSNEVAVWVEPVAALVLAERTPLVQAIETKVSDLPVARPTTTRSRAHVVGFVVACLLLASGAALFVSRERASSTTPATVTPAVPSAIPTEAASPAEPSASSPNDEPSASGRAAVLPAKRRVPSPARPTSDCDPPWVLDAAGHRRYKIECVRRSD